MATVQKLPELNFLSELYFSDAPDAVLLAEYPSSNSQDTIFQNQTKYIIHDPFPPPPKELLKVLGPHHLMCGWGSRLPVTSQVQPPPKLLDHWERVFGASVRANWQPIDSQSKFITLFPHQSLGREQQLLDPTENYSLHSKEVIEKIACPQAEVLSVVVPPCIVKLSHGYAGLGNFEIRDIADEVAMKKELGKHWPSAVLVINSIIEKVVGDYGVQFYLQKDGTPIWLGFTEQHFDGNKRWCGGTYSAHLQDELYDEFCEMIQPVAEYLHSRQYFGVVGIDILKDAAGKLFLVDVNPRLTGVSPFLMASRIFSRDNAIPEGIYQASVRFQGTYDELIELAESEQEGRVLVVSAFEDCRAEGTTTVCHLSVSSHSQANNQGILDRLLG